VLAGIIILVTVTPERIDADRQIDPEKAFLLAMTVKKPPLFPAGPPLRFGI
jgi:hypothetical protein